MLIIFVFAGGIFTYLLISKAEIADFYPAACLGGWENPQNVQGKPDLGQGAPAEEFNENNSAVLKNIISEIFCGNFQGEIPENSQSKKVLVKFSWLVKTESEAMATSMSETASTTDLIQIINLEETTSTPQNEATSTLENETSFWHPIRNLISNGASKIIHYVLARLPSPAAQAAGGQAEEIDSQTIQENPTPQENSEILEPPEVPISTLEENVPEEILTEEILTEEILIEETTTTQEIIQETPLTTSTEQELTTTTQEIVEYVGEVLSATSTEQELATTTQSEISAPKPAEPFLEILYTLDGANWQVLGKVANDNWQNLELEITNFNWQDISNLQISVKSLSPVDFIPIVYLDGLWLEVEYENLGGLKTWQNPPIPPKIQKTQAAITFERTLGGVNVSSSISINVSVVYPDDLIYDGLSGSVGLTLEALLKMYWWGIAVYTETDNFVSECVSTASPLPTAVLNLGAGDYKTEISLAETKTDCETFNQNSYPLFAVLEAANFTIK